MLDREELIQALCAAKFASARPDYSALADSLMPLLADAWDEGYIAVPAEPEDRETFVEDADNPYRAVRSVR